MTLRIQRWLSMSLFVLCSLSPAPLVPAQETVPSESQTEVRHATSEHCLVSIGSTLENIQIETADIHR
jgi:hypothetical protein